MAALLVAISVMAVMLSMALPAWSFMVRREKEEELIFRANQYARAINMYQRKYANASPPSIDVLIEQRFLRKKFKDPLSPEKDGEFQLIYQGQQQPAGARGTGAGSSTGGARGVGSAPLSFQSSSGPIIGVVSKNTGPSIRIFKGKQKYNEWQFLGIEMSNQAGAGATGAAGRGTGTGGADGRGSLSGTGAAGRGGFSGRGSDGRAGAGQAPGGLSPQIR
jgi:type II secretory pathway pseudopilin PulG